jgi:hypothetical protein
VVVLIELGGDRVLQVEPFSKYERRMCHSLSRGPNTRSRRSARGAPMPRSAPRRCVVGPTPRGVTRARN